MTDSALAALDTEFGDDFDEPETKRFDFDAELKADDDDSGVFTGMASTFGNKDLTGDVIERGAFAKSLRRRPAGKVKLLFAHDTRQPIGRIEELEETDRGLRMKARLAVGGRVPKADEVHDLMKIGAFDALSIGFITKDAEFDRDANVRRIKEIDLLEVSVVTFPANPRARIQRVKTIVSFQDLPLAPQDRPWSGTRAVQRVRRLTDSTDEPSARYRGAFVWHDRADGKDFGAYKLPIADVIGDELMAVPRGIIAAAGALQGARGGVAMPEADKAAARRHLTRYFRKMAEEFDDDTIVPPWERRDADEAYRDTLAANADLIGEDERAFEEFLRDAGFSRREAKAIVAEGFKQAISPPRDADGGLSDLVAKIKEATRTLTGAQ